MSRFRIALATLVAAASCPAFSEEAGTEPKTSIELVNAAPETRISVGYYDGDYACSVYHPITSMAKLQTMPLQLPKRAFRTLTFQYVDMRYTHADSMTRVMSCTGTFTFRADDADAYRITFGIDDRHCLPTIARSAGTDASTGDVEAVQRKRIIPVPGPNRPWCQPDPRFAHPAPPSDPKMP
jgi:hypothetical protein